MARPALSRPALRFPNLQTRCLSSPFSTSSTRISSKRHLLSRPSLLLQCELRTNFHTLPKRTAALPPYDVARYPFSALSRQQQQVLQRQSALGRSSLQIQWPQQSGRRNKHSYQRFDGRGGSGFAENRLQHIWRVYRLHIVGGGTAITVFYVYNLEEVPVGICQCIGERANSVLSDENAIQDEPSNNHKSSNADIFPYVDHRPQTVQLRLRGPRDSSG